MAICPRLPELETARSVPSWVRRSGPTSSAPTKLSSCPILAPVAVLQTSTLPQKVFDATRRPSGLRSKNTRAHGFLPSLLARPVARFSISKVLVGPPPALSAHASHVPSGLRIGQFAPVVIGTVCSTRRVRTFQLGRRFLSVAYGRRAPASAKPPFPLSLGKKPPAGPGSTGGGA